MTTSTDVKKEVLDVIKKMVRPGEPVTKKTWKFAYEIVRTQAIADTLLWKQQHITIER